MKLNSIKSVSMLLFLSGAAGNLAAAPSVQSEDASMAVDKVQQNSACTGTVKDVNGEPVIGHQLWSREPREGLLQVLMVISTSHK